MQIKTIGPAIHRIMIMMNNDSNMANPMKLCKKQYTFC